MKGDIDSSPRCLFLFNWWTKVTSQNAKAYNIQDSQAVSDPSTNWTQRCLTCQIGRDGVYSTFCAIGL
uniref:Uncharacterized protein n=1 Tax=Caenorhabditis japonica TaxID=281687 RepID=A0A8R1EK81_CAEJA